MTTNSMSIELPDSARAVLDRIGDLSARSARDSELRARLLADGTAVLRAEGLPFDGEHTVAFIENKGLTTIVLPEFNDPSSELADADLETVAGGIIPLAVGAAWFLGGCVVGMCAYLAGKKFG